MIYIRQKLSVNSYNSDMGNLDSLSANNSLKDKGRDCTNSTYHTNIVNY